MGEAAPSFCFTFFLLHLDFCLKGVSVEKRITMAHGSGGRATERLIEEIFAPRFQNAVLARMNDAALVKVAGGRLAMATDGHVVSPLFFPGGDIGRIAICGTVNDLAMMGARPRWLTLSFILEEGLSLDDLARVADSMATAAEEAGVLIVAGDTKVVERGHGDGLFISAAGVGVVPPGVAIDAASARPGDVVLINGPVGNHGITLMLQREGLQFVAPVRSDAAPLNHIVAALLEAAPSTHTLRDATRGGLATALNEIARTAGVGVIVDEEAVPVDEAVRGACGLLGLDPLYVANEGVFVAFVPREEAEAALAAMRAHPLGRRAQRIGRVVAEHPGQVVLATPLGAQRLLPSLSGNLLPRIC